MNAKLCAAPRRPQEFERDLISERLRDAKAGKRQHGLRSGGLVPYGFVAAPDTRQLTPVRAESELVRQMFERAAAGATPVEIAAWLNGQGAVTKKTGKVGGKAWTARAVLRVLENRAYLGEIGGTRAAHDPAVDAELFERANAAVRARRTRLSGRRKAEDARDPFLLRGQVRCVRCGRIMTTASAPSQKFCIILCDPCQYPRCARLGPTGTLTVDCISSAQGRAPGE